VEPAPLIVADPPEPPELLELLPPEVELELELEPHAAIPSDAASASATAEMRLEVKVLSPYSCTAESPGK
jgi:hypothetical protein